MSTGLLLAHRMEGDHASLRTPRRYNRGHAGGHGPATSPQRIRGGELDGYSTSTTWRRW
ncbi:hypothetical protein GS536_18915 [Rhodococcus hoagii]|nr:hypothetical protein [Prescottella equi]